MSAGFVLLFDLLHLTPRQCCASAGHQAGRGLQWSDLRSFAEALREDVGQRVSPCIGTALLGAAHRCVGCAGQDPAAYYGPQKPSCPAF